MSRKVYSGRAAQSDPLTAADWDASDRAALMALRECRATPEEQRLYLAWFLRATGGDELEFRPDARLSAIATGKRWILKQFSDICASTVRD
jgi:hypothetical protein